MKYHQSAKTLKKVNQRTEVAKTCTIKVWKIFYVNYFILACSVFAITVFKYRQDKIESAFDFKLHLNLNCIYIFGRHLNVIVNI